MRAQYRATDVEVNGWVDMPEAEPRSRVAVPAGRPDLVVIVDNDGKLLVSDPDTGLARLPEDGELLVDTYPNPDDRP